MKIVIQIPCFNEEENIASTLSEIKYVIKSMDKKIEILVIDDGSTDRTLEILEHIQVDHVLRIPKNQGLANAFQRGIDHSLTLGADIIVNTDGDGQYPANRIPELIQPILDGSADVVLGDRETSRSTDFSFMKRLFQSLGSWTASKLCNVEINDAATGFRAYSRDSAAWLHMTTKYTYTLESLVQLSQGNFRIANQIVGRNKVDRPSRLFKSPFQYVIKNGGTLIRVWIQYRSLRFFAGISVFCLLLGFALLAPFAFAKITNQPNQHIQLVIFSAVALGSSPLFLVLGILGDSIRSTRIISQKTLQLVKLG
jgi:glycosyltransferase involved in cell wall biosynthesis